MPIRRSWSHIHFEMTFFLLKYFRTVSETVWEQVFQVFLRTYLQTCFHGFSDLWAADFSENIWDIFCLAVQSKRRFTLSILLKRFFQVYLGKRFYFYLILEKDFILKKNAFHNLVILEDNT